MHQLCIENHMTATYPYIRAENSSTGCTSKHGGFFEMLLYCSVLNCFILNVRSVRSVVNQRKNSNIFIGLNVFFKALNICFWQVSQSFDFLAFYLYCRENYDGKIRTDEGTRHYNLWYFRWANECIIDLIFL